MVIVSRTRHLVRAALNDVPALLVACLIALSAVTNNAAARQIVVEISETKHAGEFIVPINKSQVLRLDVPFSKLLVGKPEIADVLALTDRSIYVLGKGLGTTSLTIYGEDKKLIAVVDLIVALDIGGLKARLFELMPDERIEIRPAVDSVILSGSVSSSGQLRRILAVAERYAPEKVTNLLSVRGSQQVMLSVRFAEVARTVMKDLGIRTSLTNQTGSLRILTNDFGNRTVDALAATAFAAGSLTGIGLLGKFTLDVLFDMLEKKGVVRTLAEPNLIALSGDTATFLAGGEFPVPQVQDSGEGGTPTITVDYKQFGVSLSFTPTVLDNGLINLVVKPEVSKIDTANSVTLSGFVIPALTTRRVTTTVELRDGQSFAIAGLLQNDFQDTIRQFPLLGDVPILGTLFRSAEFQRNETELVIIITPHLVRPAEAATMATPVDQFVPPSQFDMFLLGRTEAAESGSPLRRGAAALSVRGAGGIDGRYGHIIR